MRLPIETSNLTFIVVAPPQPVLDFDSKQALRKLAGCDRSEQIPVGLAGVEQ